MGSCMSGWYGRRSGRPRTDEACYIDLIEWRQRGWLETGGFGLLESSDLAAAGVRLMEVDVALELASLSGSAELRIRVLGSRDVVFATVDLEATTQPLGGVRWWFVCSACAGRFLKLYCVRLDAVSDFACRQCHNLQYASRVLGRAERAKRNAERLYSRAGSRMSATFHPRPKWMRSERFNDLIDRAERYDAEWQHTAVDAHMREATRFFQKVRKRHARLGLR